MMDEPQPTYYLVNLDTGLFTPTGFDMIDPPADSPIARVEIEGHPTAEQQEKILLVLRSKRGGSRRPVDEEELECLKMAAALRAHMAKYTAAHGGSMIGYADSTGVPQSVVHAIVSNQSVTKANLESAIGSIRDRRSVGKRT